MSEILSEKAKQLIRDNVDEISVCILEQQGNFKAKYPDKRPIKPRLKKDHTSIQALDYAESLVEYEQEKHKFDDAVANYRQNLTHNNEAFKYATFYELGMDWDDNINHRAWGYAWEYGHSAGLYEVYNRFEELNDRILKYIPGKVTHVMIP